ncbi:farnesyl pyrophosphate synthase-like [Galleria mellonella]|uniref:Farnesyl pyrophosphate synthase-like n=1 Tax=Galleria mellonella TaxID=7137 RepID=A0A6J1X206_GALME|nr:farnesyl pyrophosphate synthase-like [Galleria mellonella]
MKNLKYLAFCISRNYCSQSIRQKQEIANALISHESFVKFQNSVPEIVNTILIKRAHLSLLGVEDHIKKIADYGLYNGNKLSSSLLLYTYKKLETGKSMTEQSLYLAHVLAWAVEMFHCLFNILDDMQDKTNAQVKNVHLLSNAKAGANDMCLIISSIYEMLNVHFSGKTFFSKIVNLFNTAFLYKATGQHFDLTTSKAMSGNTTLFTMEQYDNFVYLSNTYCSLHLPIYLGMTLADKVNEMYCEDVQDICTDIGKLLQMQDDYQNCFEENDMIYKRGTDIEKGKCTWLAVTALQRCTRPQRIVFKSCYGSAEPAHMERIKLLYKQLKLPQLYKEQQKATSKRIVERMGMLSKNNKGETLPPELFEHFLKPNNVEL